MKHVPIATVVRAEVWYLILIGLGCGLATSAVLGAVVLLLASAA